MASRRLVPPALILGHVIAHEIGHVLLNLENHHSPAGIMRGEWNPRVLEDAKAGILVFQASRLKSSGRKQSGGRDRVKG